MELLPVCKKLGIGCGYCTTENSRKIDCLFNKHSDHQPTECVKKKHKQLRAIKKGFPDKNELELTRNIWIWAILTCFLLAYFVNMRSFLLAFLQFYFFAKFWSSRKERF